MVNNFRSVVRRCYGPPEILKIETIQSPALRPPEIRVRVHASTVNRTDCGGLWGKPFIFRFFAGFPNPRHLATGSDFSGEVVEVGSTVKRFKVGDRVFGFNDHGLGSHAEYMVIGESGSIETVPDSITHEQAAASLEGVHYAYNFINKVNVQPGTRVLVNGATGAIGSAAVQILKHMKAEITAVCPTALVERVRAMGAGVVIDYLKNDFTKMNLEPFDFVFDAVGKSSFGQCRPLLKTKGVYISSELGPRSENPFLALVTPYLGGKKVIFPIPMNIPETLKLVKKLLASGEFKPLIDRQYPLEKISEAFVYVASGQKLGNVLVRP